MSSEKKLEQIIERIDMLAKQLETIMDIVHTNKLTQKQQDDKFLACYHAFSQTKECCEALLDRIDEAAGTITAHTWNYDLGGCNM